MSVPYTDNEASEARQWSNRYGPPNAWTASFGTAARMIGRLLDERERLMAKQTVAAPGDDYIREWHEEFQRWKAVAEEKQDFRDHFAAAALTGLLVHANDGIDEETLDTPSDIAYTAYAMADAMLRERSRSGKNSSGGTDSAAKCTERDSANHDAAPAARAAPSESSAPLGKGLGTGDTTEPVAWAVMDGHEFMEFCTDKEEAKCAAGFYGDCPIVPLYRKPTLTDEERGAVALFAATAWSGLRWSEVEKHAATLRGLLERTGGGK